MAHRRRGRLKGIEAAFVQATSNAFVYAYTSGLSYRATAAYLRQIERVFVQQLRSKPRHALEVRRRIAEQLLKEAIRLQCSFPVLRTRMRHLQALGFSTIEVKSTHYFIYARAAMQNGHRRLALRMATEMAGEWERSLRRRRSLAGKKDLQLFRSLLAEIQRRRV